MSIRTNEKKKLRNILTENFQKPMRYCEIDEWFARSEYQANYCLASVTTFSSYKCVFVVTSKAIRFNLDHVLINPRVVFGVVGNNLHLQNQSLLRSLFMNQCNLWNLFKSLN